MFEHKEAAIGNKAADRALLVRAMNCVLAASKRHGGDVHWVTLRAAAVMLVGPRRYRCIERPPTACLQDPFRPDNEWHQHAAMTAGLPSDSHDKLSEAHIMAW